jgi:dihydroorotate dehydrogenase
MNAHSWRLLLLFLSLAPIPTLSCESPVANIAAACTLLNMVGEYTQQSRIKKNPLVGIAACPLTASAYMTALSACTYKPDFIETKTYRDVAHSYAHAHAIRYLENTKQLSWKDLEKPLYTLNSAIPDTYDRINMANAVGMPSPDLATTRATILRTMTLLKKYTPHTNLIFSVHGSSIGGFGRMARLANELQVPYVSANLSCPNLGNKSGLMYKDPAIVARIVTVMKRELGTIPLIIKVGAFKPSERLLMEEIITKVAANGAYAIYGINSIPARVLNKDGSPTFGPDREICGVTGTQIRTLAKEFVQDAHEIIKRKNLNLRIFACGGVTNSEDFDFYGEIGADAVLCATSIMANPDFHFPTKKLPSKL